MVRRGILLVASARFSFFLSPLPLRTPHTTRPSSSSNPMRGHRQRKRFVSFLSFVGYSSTLSMTCKISFFVYLRPADSFCRYFFFLRALHLPKKIIKNARIISNRRLNITNEVRVFMRLKTVWRCKNAKICRNI